MCCEWPLVALPRSPVYLADTTIWVAEVAGAGQSDSGHQGTDQQKLEHILKQKFKVTSFVYLSSLISSFELWQSILIASAFFKANCAHCIDLSRLQRPLGNDV